MQMQMIVDGLLALEFQTDEHGNSIPFKISLSEKAKARFIEMFNTLASEMQEMYEALRSLWSKMAGRIARIALVLHCIRLADGEKVEELIIDERTMQSAIEIGRWYANEAQRCYSHFGVERIGNDIESDVLEMIRQAGENGMTKREIHRKKPRYKDYLNVILNSLVKAEKMVCKERKRDGPGSKTKVYYLLE